MKRRRTKRRFLLLAVLIALVAAIMNRQAIIDSVYKVLYPIQEESQITAACQRYGLDPYLVFAIIKCESNWQDDAESSAGAQGLMQLMPSTAESLVHMGLVDGNTWDPNNLKDPATNIEYGCAYLAFLQRNLSNESEVIAAYNAGIGTVQTWISQAQAQGVELSHVITYPETSGYLQKVIDAYHIYQNLYGAQHS